MKVIELAKEAEKLNVPFDFVSEAYEKALHEGKIYGLLVPKKAEIIQYNPNEMYNLIDRLRSNSVTPKELESELKLENAYVILVLDFLLKENRIKGILTRKGPFLTNPILKHQILEAVQKNGNVDLTEISTQLSVSEGEVRRVIEEISSQVVMTIAPYKQIKIKDLGAELGISEGSILPLLRRIISERRVSAQLDMINYALVIEEHKTIAGKGRAIEQDRNSVDGSSEVGNKT